MAKRVNTAPENEQVLPAGQEMDEAVLAEGVFHPYAVTAEHGLRLRAEPSLGAPVLAVLPCGAGVFGDAEADGYGWRRVFSGRLSGWMMDEYLEELPMPELGNAAG